MTPEERAEYLGRLYEVATGRKIDHDVTILIIGGFKDVEEEKERAVAEECARIARNKADKCKRGGGRSRSDYAANEIATEIERRFGVKS